MLNLKFVNVSLIFLIFFSCLSNKTNNNKVSSEKIIKSAKLASSFPLSSLYLFSAYVWSTNCKDLLDKAFLKQPKSDSPRYKQNTVLYEAIFPFLLGPFFSISHGTRVQYASYAVNEMVGIYALLYATKHLVWDNFLKNKDNKSKDYESSIDLLIIKSLFHALILLATPSHVANFLDIYIKAYQNYGRKIGKDDKVEIPCSIFLLGASLFTAYRSAEYLYRNFKHQFLRFKKFREKKIVNTLQNKLTQN